MKKIFVILFIIGGIILFLGHKTNKAPAPTNNIEISSYYKGEQEVTMDGYHGDSMEPFITRDGNFIFFNSLNDGKTTSLYYAEKITGNIFKFKGQVGGTNGQKPHLDAVASLDNEGNFYWVSLRNYPSVFENLQTGTWRNGTVTDIHPVEGNFYVRENGWIIMDAEISPDGQDLYYVNADFTKGGAIPEKTTLGVAHKKDGKFYADTDNEKIFAAINEIGSSYAPSISDDGLILVFTRLLNRTVTQMFIAKRDDVNQPFNNPQQIDIVGDLPEGGSLTLDGKDLYYHKKMQGIYQIFKVSR